MKRKWAVEGANASRR
jgi:hypothetical protein